MSYQTIEFEDFLQKVKAEQLNVIDVRSVEQFEAHQIEGAMNIPLEVLEQERINLSKDEPYYVVCQRGVKSAKAAHYLASQGYEVINVNRGMSALEESV